jgi:hypothetical protein
MNLRRVLLATTAVFAVLSAPASAATSSSCTSGPLSKPFAPWLDSFNYFQAPGGGFESGLTTWSPSGGARIVLGNEPWNESGRGTSSLYLPNGASVTSPSFCGGLGYPTVRLFYKGGGLPGLTNLRVDVVYTDNRGLLQSFGLGALLPAANWAPSLPMLTLSGLPLLTGSQLALRITAAGASYSVDDVYVDPYSRH